MAGSATVRASLRESQEPTVLGFRTETPRDTKTGAPKTGPSDGCEPIMNLHFTVWHSILSTNVSRWSAVTQ
jgi:hypothetical protein